MMIVAISGTAGVTVALEAASTVMVTVAVSAAGMVTVKVTITVTVKVKVMVIVIAAVTVTVMVEIKNMNLVTCIQCKKEINLRTDAQTSCSGCDENFCCALTHTCFSDYHKKNNITSGHSSLTILDPSWKVNLRT